MKLGNWTWLETIKLIVSMLTPVLVAVIGIYIHRTTKKFEQTQWRNQKLVEKRIAVYDDLAPLLNDALCYFTYIGNWKEMTPADMVKLKRDMDKKAYLAAPLFSESFFKAYTVFQGYCYSTFRGWGKDACLRTCFQRRKEHWAEEWCKEWDECFSNVEGVTDPNEIKEAYKQLMIEFAKDLGVASNLSTKAGMIPSNIR